MQSYDFPNGRCVSTQLKKVISADEMKAFRTRIVRNVSSRQLSVGETFNVLYKARNKFIEQRPALKEWIDELMLKVISAITPNDEDFRKELLRSLDDAISS